MSKRSKRQIIREKRREVHKRNTYIRIGVVVLVLFAVIFSFLNRPEAIELDESRLASNPVLGTDTPIVTITEYGDFGCSACRAWHNAGIKNRIMSEYGDKVQFVWKDFPVITAQSPKAAEAGQCAFDQGLFWEYHDLLYDNAPAIRVDDLKTYAIQLGLDAEQFNQCLDSGQNRAKVSQNLNEARQLGLPGTPSFLVNDQRLAGPPTYESLKSIIEQAIAGG